MSNQGSYEGLKDNPWKKYPTKENNDQDRVGFNSVKPSIHRGHA